MKKYSIIFFSIALSISIHTLAQSPKPIFDTSKSTKDFLKYYNKPDTGLSKVITNMLREEKALNDSISKQLPAPADFRKAFMTLIPTMKAELRSIGSRQTSGDIGDGVTSIPAKSAALPGTSANYYESFVDGLTLTYNATLHATVDSNKDIIAATVLTDQWKSMLQLAFPENPALVTDKTDNSSNRFVNITYLTNPASPAYSGGFTLSIRNIASKEKHAIGLVIAEKKEK